ncbi:MAG: hypothetical protein EAZ37_02425 [Burkholderiales bacterium]|nr:MAG: hypothetical protein EAZ37_02425 [Burkholderiales bacterium]
MTEQNWYGGSTPIIFLRPIGIAAGDAMRLMEVAKRLRSSARWRMAPPGVAADAYLVHRHSILNADTDIAPTEPTRSSNSAWMASYSGHSQSSAMRHARKISLDHQGWHRGRPVCILGQGIDARDLEDDELAPLSFPDALVELERGLDVLLDELVGSRMLYTVGSLAWEQRLKWGTHHLHAIESGQLIAMIDPQSWQFYLLDGCGVERMAEADMVAKPRTVGFSAPGFHSFKLEVALWEFAKRCPEHLLEQILPATYLQEPLTHRRTPHLKENALGDHCVAILRALDTRSRTSDELQASLRLTRASLMRALTCLALVRAIQPEAKIPGGILNHMGSWWSRVTGKTPVNTIERRASPRLARQGA